MRDPGAMSDTAMGGWGRWNGFGNAPTPNSARERSSTRKSQYSPSWTWGGSFAHRERIASIDSRTIALRSVFPPTLKSSRSEERLPVPMPIWKRPRARWSNIAAWLATMAGCWRGRQNTPVPSLMLRVSPMRVARKTSGAVMGSVRALRCSPIQHSRKPSRSARRMVSRSS